MKYRLSVLRPWHLVLPMVLSTSIASLGAEIQWVGDEAGAEGQNWNNPLNWAGDIFPVAPDDATVNVATGNFPIISADSVFQTRDTKVGKTATGRVDHRAGVHSTNSANWTYVGQGLNGVGTYNLANTATPGAGISGFAEGTGSLNFGGRLFIGTSFESDPASLPVGTMNINTSGTITQTGTGDGNHGIYVGDGSGTGTMNLQFGRIAVENEFNVGQGGTSMGTLNVAGGSITAGQLRVGENGTSTGVMTMSGGTVVASEIYFGVGGAGKGTFTLSGGTVTANRWMNVGDSNGGDGGTGRGTVNMTGGTLNQNHTDFYSFGQSGGRGTFNMSGGLLNDPAVVDTNANEGNVTLGRNFGDNRTAGLGIWNISGSAIVNVRDLKLAADNGASPGELNVSGGTINQSNGRTLIGENGVGNATISGGVLNLQQVIAGDGEGATGNLTVTGGDFRSNGEIWFGQGGGTSTVTHSGGSVTATNWIAIARDSGEATYNLSGTGLLGKTGGGEVVIGSVFNNNPNPSTGTLAQTGGTLQTVGFGDISLGENVGATGIWNMSGGTANVDVVRVGWAGGGVGQLAVSGSAVLNATDIVVADQGNTTGTVAQTGGTVRTSGNVDIQASGATGTYNLSGGTLSVNGTLDLSNGVFGFTGGAITRSDAGVININGPLTSGENDATLKLDNNKTFAITGAFDKAIGITLDLTGLVIPAYDGSGVDTGSFALGTVGSILGEFGPALDRLVGLVNNPNATFISESQGEAGAFGTGQSFVWVQENAGNVTLQYSVVPEPGTASLLALACVGFAARRRRRA